MSVPGAFVGRFPPNPFDPEAEILIEGAYGMAVGPEQDGVFVLDRRGRRVFHLDRDANLRAAFGRPGGGPGEFEAPVSIQLDPGGDVWVSDARLSRLSRFGAGGDLRDELSTPWPVTNFGILRDGVSIYPTVEQTTLLAVQSGAEHREMEIDPAVIPDGISAHPMERLMSGALQFFPLEPNTVLMFQNRNAELFGAWRIELDPPGTRVTEVATWPLPDWIVAETESRGGVIEVEQQGERTRISEMVPFNSVRVVDDELWLVTGLIDDVLAASIPLVEGDSASIVLPPETAIDCLMDVAVLGERLVVLCETEVRFYELDRVESERFSPP
ncbi:hypothetical protein [Candidatus Palauibacter sp.]|uniref:hypothetical protein n=1 Tax=Candidatus Palauibacter sp. TaxID=3101350 RepID=UPI003AF236ED